MTKTRKFDPNSLAGRIQQRLFDLRMSANEACFRASVNPSTIKNIYSGLSQIPRSDTLLRLAAALETTPDWLLLGDDHDSEAGQKKNLVGPSLLDHRDLPVMAVLLGARDGDFIFSGHVSDYVLRPLALRHRRRAFCVLIAGSKMEPVFFDGDPVVVDPDRHPTAGDDVIVEMKVSSSGVADCYLCRFVERSAQDLILQQFHPMRRLDLSLQKIQAVYRVVPVRELLSL